MYNRLIYSIFFKNEWGSNSLTLRQGRLYSNDNKNAVIFYYLCVSGVAGIVMPTLYEKSKPSLNYLKLKRNAEGTWKKAKKKLSLKQIK